MLLLSHYPVTGLLLTCPGQTAQLITGLCAHDRRVAQQFALNVHVKKKHVFYISYITCI